MAPDAAGIRALALALGLLGVLVSGGCANPELRQTLENLNQTLTSIAVLKKARR
ncbi:MAG: hypothetical protein O2905_08160 [Proteobacteria bacterium]|nr:hypothetical protein [Pseudomonadota bacterium]MDA1133177.1 hypothetical protein [Pseudomonadota bacterium]